MSPTASQPIVTAPGGREPILSSAPPGAPPEGPPFQSALETESARTAIAEGQQQSHSQSTSPTDGEPASAAETFDRLPHGSAQPARRHSGHHATPLPGDAKTSAGVASCAPTLAGSTPMLATALPGATASGELAASATGELVAGSTGTATTGTSSPAASVVDGTPNPGAPSAPGSCASAEGAPTAAAAVAHEDVPLSSPTSPADGAPPATAHDGAPTASAPATAHDGTSTAGGPATLGGSAPIASGGAPAAGAGAGGNANAGGGGNPTHTDANRAAGPVRPRDASDAGAHDKLWVADPGQASPEGAASGGSSAGGLSENTASPLTLAATDGNSAAPSGELAAAGYGVGLQEAIESLHGTIQLAARQGLAQARISLQPEELGEIRINLTQTAQGLLARVTAESPAAAQALAAAHAQLRQSLSSLGINLTRLEIGHHDPSAQSGGAGTKGNGGHNDAARGEGSSEGRPNRPDRAPAIAAPTDPETASPLAAGPAISTSAPLTGALIDVLV